MKKKSFTKMMVLQTSQLSRTRTGVSFARNIVTTCRCGTLEFETALGKLRAVIIAALVLAPILAGRAQTVTANPAYTIVDRGPYYRVMQRILSITNVNEQVSRQVQSYTELGDGMHYLENGKWVESQDLIEITPTGAAAVHGQLQASFSSDITSRGAISLTSSAGEIFQSRPVGLYYADSASGKVASIAPIQSSEGVLYPPNVVVFSNVLSGLSADFMIVWTKQGYEQNLVLKQSPPAPESFGLSSKTSRL